MNLHSRFPRLLTVVALILTHLASPVAAQGLDGLATDIMTARKNNDWPTALSVATRATNSYDGRAPTLFGPRFGWFWFQRGIAEYRMGKYVEAMGSFQTCVTKYANKKAKVGDKKANSINMNENIAYLYWGHSAKAAGEWKLALQKYDEFLKRRDPTRDKMQKGMFYVNRAVCNFKLKQFAKGIQDLETAIKGKKTFPTSNTQIMSAFTTMVEAIIEKKDEPVLLNFIQKNRGHLSLAPFEAYEYAKLFMKLANDAKGAEMFRSSFELYALVPSTQAAQADTASRLESVGTYPATVQDGTRAITMAGLQETLDKVESDQTKGTLNEMYAFVNTAVMHEGDGNVRGAFAVYEQLENYFPRIKIMKKDVLVPAREQNLYNLVRTSAILSEVLATEKYGRRFLKAFPTSKYVPEVRRLMLESLFWSGKYQNCIQIASRMIDELAEPSKEHDICLFVLGGSYFYNGQSGLAQPLLEKYIRTYPETDDHRRMAALYFRASNLTRLQEWKKAGALLDQFMKAYPKPSKNPYMPFALFDRANAHYALDEFQQAHDNCHKVETEHQGVVIMEMNYNLKGNVLEQLGKLGEAEEYHKKALVMAETRSNDYVAAEALYHLVRIIGVEKDAQNRPNPRILEALDFYNKFFEEYGDIESPFESKMAVAGLPAMKKAGKMDEALERLQGVIVKISSDPDNPDLEPVINTYKEAYLENHTPEQLKDHFYNFQGIDLNDEAARALLRIAVINTYEDVIGQAKKEEDEEKLSQAQTRVKVLFEELRNDFDTQSLSPYILVKLGEFLRERTSSPLQAVTFYEEALKREGHDYKFAALFGLADVLASGSGGQRAKAARYLQQVIDSSDKKSQRESALFRLIEILYEQGNYTAAIDKAKTYLKDLTYRKFSAQVRFLLGMSYDKNGQREDAMAILAQVFGTSPGFMKVSAPAVKRWMELTWERNRSGGDGKSDRQIAYEGGYKWLNNTANIVKRMTKEDEKLRDQVSELVQTYEAQSDTVSMKEIEAQKDR